MGVGREFVSSVHSILLRRHQFRAPPPLRFTKEGEWAPLLAVNVMVPVYACPARACHSVDRLPRVFFRVWTLTWIGDYRGGVRVVALLAHAKLAP